MSESYIHSSVVSFGKALISQKDLDPIYEMLFQSTMKGEQLYKWLLAYWLFYHAGVASWIVEAPNFYKACLWAFDQNFPRGTERRHFRGDLARKAIVEIQEKHPNPAKLVESLYSEKFIDVHKKVKELPQFGNWIAFKVADMLERCAGMDIDFSGEGLLFFYDQPRAGALLVFEENNLRNDWLRKGRGGKIYGQLQDKVEAAVKFVQSHIETIPAPPDNRRMCNVQEVETILCKYKSHRNGHYPVGKDMKEVRHALDNYGKLASELKEGIL